MFSIAVDAESLALLISQVKLSRVNRDRPPKATQRLPSETLNLELLLIKTSKCLRDTLRLVNAEKAWDHPITTEQGETPSE